MVFFTQRNKKQINIFKEVLFALGLFLGIGSVELSAVVMSATGVNGSDPNGLYLNQEVTISWHTWATTNPIEMTFQPIALEFVSATEGGTNTAHIVTWANGTHPGASATFKVKDVSQGLITHLQMYDGPTYRDRETLQFIAAAQETPVPEPSTYLLIGSMCSLIPIWKRRKEKSTPK